MNRPRSQRALLVCLLFLLCPLLVHGQVGNQGSLEGNITDPAGAVVPGVAVKARNLQTSATFQTTTTQEGLFRFAVLPVGTYELLAEHAGFAPLTVKEVAVSVGAKIHLSLTLRLATHAESVVVESDPHLLETTRTSIGATVDNRAIAELPVHGREFISFVLLTPGVTNDIRGGLSFAGQRAMNSLLVDGVDQNDSFFDQPLGFEGFSNPRAGTSQYLFSQDAVQEFQVNSSSYSVEFGRASGGVTNAITKSGTNEFHGSAYWFFRDRSLNATDLVNKLNSQPKDPFHFNQFGGTVGGPIRRNKLFFFINYEGLRSKKGNAVFLSLPPGFQLSSNPTAAGFQQRALDYLQARAFSWVLPFRQDVFLTKFDWQLTPAHWLTGRWVRQRRNMSSGGAQNSFETSAPTSLDNDVLSASLTSTLSPSTVNAFRFAYVHTDNPSVPRSANPLAAIFEAGQLVLNIGRAPNTWQRNRLNRVQFSDTLSYNRGRHSLKAGTDFLLDSNSHLNAQNFSGNYLFLSLESFGRSLAGVPAPLPGEQYLQAFSGEGTPGAHVHPNVYDFAGFIEDEWRLRPNLTLTLGLRYDLQVSARPPVKNPSPALAAAGIDTSALPTDKNNFAPRVGLAWSPLNNQRLVVRFGYGIFYSPTIALLLARAHFQNGITVQLRTFRSGTPSAALIPAYPNNFCGPPNPTALAPSCAPSASGTVNPIITPFAHDHVEPYVQQGNLGIEVELQKDLTLSATYLVAKGTHLAQTRDVNLRLPQTRAQIGIAGTTTTLTYEFFTPPRPIAGFDRILVFESDANSIYHGLAVQATKRFSHNFQCLGSYTFSKVIDDNPNQYAANPGPPDGVMVADPSNRRADRGAGNNDQRHRFVLSGIWELNYASHLPPVAKALLGGWQFSGILAAQSGHPYSGLVSFDLNNDRNNATDRTPGLGRDTFYLPATVSLDLRVTRTVQLGEGMKLLLSGEAFNFFNHGNITSVRTTQFAFSSFPADCGVAGTPCLVPTTSGLTAFGTATATSGPRIIQFSAKLVF